MVPKSGVCAAHLKRQWLKSRRRKYEHKQQKQSRKVMQPGYSKFNVSAVQSRTLLPLLTLMLAIGYALENLTLRVSE